MSGWTRRPGRAVATCASPARFPCVACGSASWDGRTSSSSTGSPPARREPPCRESRVFGNLFPSSTNGAGPSPTTPTRCSSAGALFYGQTRRRLDVRFGDDLRRETEEAAARLHRLLASGVTPQPVREPKCDQCSLIDLCLPGAPAHSARRFLDRLLQSAAEERDASQEPA